jgi:hypothetical protein
MPGAASDRKAERAAGPSGVSSSGVIAMICGHSYSGMEHAIRDRQLRRHAQFRPGYEIGND